MNLHAAVRLRDDETFKAACEQVRQNTKEEWAATPLAQVDQMMRLRMRLQVLDDLVSHLDNAAYELSQPRRD